MLATALLSLSIAHADVAIPPPDGKQFMNHDLVVEGLDAHPDVVLVVMDRGDTVTAYRSFAAGKDTRQTLAKGNRRRGGGMSAPTVRLMTKPAFEAWQTEARAAVDAQREACSERGEGCAHISRFVGKYPAPKGAVDCGLSLDLVTSGPEGGPNQTVDTIALEAASATRCTVVSKGRHHERDGMRTDAPPPAEPAVDGAAPAPPSCNTLGGVASVGAGLAMLGLAMRRRKGASPS
jgi:hypothetical protein